MIKFLKIFLGIAALGIVGFFTIPYFLFLNDIQQDKSEITEVTNELGLVVERFGNENSWDNDVNFRELLKYNKEKQLIESRYYSLQDDNTEFKILDSLSCILTKYTYNTEDQLEFERKYQRSSFKSKELELFYTYNHITKQELPE